MGYARAGPPEQDAISRFSKQRVAASYPLKVQKKHLFRHDRRAGLSTSGKRTAATGKEINFVGPSNEPDWRVALREILEKVEAKGCRRRAFVQWDTHC